MEDAQFSTASTHQLSQASALVQVLIMLSADQHHENASCRSDLAGPAWHAGHSCHCLCIVEHDGMIPDALMVPQCRAADVIAKGRVSVYVLSRKAFEGLLGPYEDMWKFEVLRKVPILFNLSEQQLFELARCMTSHRMKANQTVFRQGDPGERCQLVLLSCLVVDLGLLKSILGPTFARASAAVAQVQSSMWYSQKDQIQWDHARSTHGCTKHSLYYILVFTGMLLMLHAREGITSSAVHVACN